jgi:hypothetical protein
VLVDEGRGGEGSGGEGNGGGGNGGVVRESGLCFLFWGFAIFFELRVSIFVEVCQFFMFLKRIHFHKSAQTKISRL